MADYSKYSDTQVETLRESIRETKKSMRDNAQKVVDRHEKLDSLEMKSQGLSERAALLSVRTKKVKNKAFWERVKERMRRNKWAFIGAACGIVTLVIIGILLAILLTR